MPPCTVSFLKAGTTLCTKTEKKPERRHKRPRGNKKNLSRQHRLAFKPYQKKATTTTTLRGLSRSTSMYSRSLLLLLLLLLLLRHVTQQTIRSVNRKRKKNTHTTKRRKGENLQRNGSTHEKAS